MISTLSQQMVEQETPRERRIFNWESNSITVPDISTEFQWRTSVRKVQTKKGLRRLNLYRSIRILRELPTASMRSNSNWPSDNPMRKQTSIPKEGTESTLLNCRPKEAGLADPPHPGTQIAPMWMPMAMVEVDMTGVTMASSKVIQSSMRLDHWTKADWRMWTHSIIANSCHRFNNKIKLITNWCKSHLLISIDLKISNCLRMPFWI